MPQAQVLNVGRTHRLATLKQRRAIIARQDGQCAAPGCHHTHLEIHHVTPYSEGGRTNLDEMVGLCVRCHHLVHRGTLQIRPTSHPGLYDVQGRDPKPGHEAYRRRRDAWRETRTIRRIAHHVRERHESRLITPMRT